MKQKTIGVLLVIALVASLCVVAAAPATVGAQTGVTNVDFANSPNTANYAAQWNIGLTTSAPGGALAGGTGVINIKFPPECDMPTTIKREYVTVNITIRRTNTQNIKLTNNDNENAVKYNIHDINFASKTDISPLTIGRYGFERVSDSISVA